MKIANPIVQKIHDNESSLKKFENIMNKKKIKDNIILTHYPVVYIHVWKNKDNYELYVGESNNIFQRTRNHYKNSKSNNNWQNNLITKNADLYIIGHEHFNKSLTLDIENKLYHYLSGVESVSKIYNARGNPQNQYYTANEFNKIFQKIWDKLRDYNANLFPYENKILDSAIFKSSPFHKLTKDQNNLKDLIVNKMAETIVTQKKGQLIFIEGESGTGKTVLNSSTFYEIYNYKETSLEEDQNQFESLNKKLDCNLIINNNEQFKVYKRIFKKLCDDKTELVYKATRFINRHSKDKPVDISFVDEAHLLLTHGKQSYKGKNQLQDIMDRSKITIIMFDPLQIQNIDQYWEHKVLMKYKNMAKLNNTYFELTEQLRIKAKKEVLNWIDDFSKNGIVNNLPSDTGNYEIKVFDTPYLLEKAIKQKAQNKSTGLSRMVATYDWEYKDGNTDNIWEVKIGKWHKPWNYQIEKKYSSAERKKLEEIPWAEQSQTINEIGSIFSIQGFDLNYVGLIIGPSIQYRDNKIKYCSEYSFNNQANKNRTLSDGRKEKFSEILLRNQLRVLMTRGVNGLYIYACDKELRNHLKKSVGKKYIIK